MLIVTHGDRVCTRDHVHGHLHDDHARNRGRGHAHFRARGRDCNLVRVRVSTLFDLKDLANFIAYDRSSVHDHCPALLL